MKLRALAASSAIVSSFFLLPQVAFAQSTDAQPKQEEQNNEPESAIVVTGSRIARLPTLESPVPVTTITADQVLGKGNLSLGDALNFTPSMRASYSQANSTRFIGTAGLNLLDLRGLGSERTLVLVDGRRHVTSTPGSYAVDVNTIPTDLVETIDVVTGGSSAVYGSDAVAGVVNFVLKKDYQGLQLKAQGGASDKGDRGSYYVSAVAGHNFFDGRLNISGAVEYSQSNPLFYSDRPDFTGAFEGTPGWVTSQPAYINNVPVPNRNNDGIPNTRYISGKPGITYNTLSLGGTVLATCPAATATNADRRSLVCTGQLSPTNGRLAYNFMFQPDGTLVRNDTITDLRNVGGGTLGGIGATGVEDAMLMAGLKRTSAVLLMSGEVSPAFQPFFQGEYVHITARQQSTQPTFIASALSPIFRLDNPFLTPQAVATLQRILAPGATTFQMQRFNNDFGTRAEDHKRDTYRFVGGVKGTISTTANLNYEVAVNWGRTETYYQTGGNVSLERYANAVDAVRSGSNIVCRVNADADPTNDDPRCVPLNVFGYGAPSRAALNYVLHTSERNEWAEELDVTAFLSGDSSGIFELPGGPAGFSLGLEYRREDAYSAYDAYTAQGNTFLNGSDPFDPPAIKTKEAFGEIRLPLLKDLPLIRSLTVSGAARVTDYNSMKDPVWAWNASGTWSPTRGVMFRVGYARSVRAPNLGDLYSTASTNYANGLVDPCSQSVIRDNPNRARNCAAAGIPTTIVVDGVTIPWENTPASGVQYVDSGNRNLKAEKGTSLTVGAVFTPAIIPGLSFTVDYYNIKVTDSIASLSGQEIVNRCYDDPVSINNPFCAAVNRRSSTDPLLNYTFAGQSGRTFAGIPTVNMPVLGPAFAAQPFNYAKLKTSGIDFDLSYNHSIAPGVKLSVRALVGYLLNREQFSYITDPSRSDRIHGTLGDPEIQGTLDIGLDFGTFDVRYSGRYIGRQTIASWETQFSWQGRAPTNPDAYPIKWYSPVTYHDLRIGVNPTDKFRLYAGVDNLFDKMPPYGLTGTGGGSGIFPNIGRFFYAGVQTKF